MCPRVQRSGEENQSDLCWYDCCLHNIDHLLHSNADTAFQYSMFTSCIWIKVGSTLKTLYIRIYHWHDYRIGTISIMRVIEVVGIGLLTGILFQDVGW